MVSGRPEGYEEGRWREPCTRCPLERAQRWWEKKKEKTVHCGARFAQRSSHAWLQRLTRDLTGEAKSSFAPSRALGNDQTAELKCPD